MLDFHEVNCEVKIRQNIVQIWETINDSCDFCDQTCFCLYGIIK